MTGTVIAIAGPPGSGKTALIAALGEILPQATALFFDGFETPSDLMSPAALRDWLQAGARFDDFAIVRLTEALAALRAGHQALEPASGRIVPPAPLVLFEMPFARAHAPTASLIDFMVWLDTPRDVALARNILAWESEARPRPWLAGYMRDYLAVTSDVLAAQRAAVRPLADLVLDGLAPPQEAAQKLLYVLQTQNLLALTGTGS